MQNACRVEVERRRKPNKINARAACLSLFNCGFHPQPDPHDTQNENAQNKPNFSEDTNYAKRTQLQRKAKMQNACRVEAQRRRKPNYSLFIRHYSFQRPNFHGTKNAKRTQLFVLKAQFHSSQTAFYLRHSPGLTVKYPLGAGKCSQTY